MSRNTKTRRSELPLPRRAASVLLARHAPPSVIVSALGEVLHVIGAVTPFLDPFDPSRLRPDLAVALEARLRSPDACAGGEVELVVEPLDEERGEPRFLVVFRPQDGPRFDAIFERAAIGLALLDARGRVVAANARLCAMLRRTQADLAGVPLEAYVHPDDRARDRALLAMLLEGRREHVESETRYEVVGGPTRLFHRSVSMIPGHRRSRCIVCLRDVTESQRAAEHLREMAALVAHEVRNALAGIGSAVEVIGHALPGGSGEREAMDEVRSRMGRLDAMVDDLLRFARPRPPRVGAVSALAVLAQIARALAEGEHSVRLAIRGPDATLLADRELIASALLSLCRNAAQAVEAGSTIRVVVRERDGRAELHIADEGGGIPSSLREHVFEPFFTTRTRGTGLGLPNARRIVEAHGGELCIESDEGRGTTVIVRLPLLA